MTRERVLLPLWNQVQARVDALTREHPGWPCGRGCDTCCKRLARPPVLTEAEWRALQPALRALPVSDLQACLGKADALAAQVREHGETQPVECPLLNSEHGSCRVYEARPVACRSYGFYVSRDHDAWCGRVAEHVQGAEHALVFGNQVALEHDLQSLAGEARDLLAWLAELR